MRIYTYAHLRAKKAKKHAQFVALFNKFMSNPAYADIVNKAKKRGLKKPKTPLLDSHGRSIRYESHHIVPKCCGGYDYKYNTVLLTRYEHLKCHEILAAMGYAVYAFEKMTGKYEKRLMEENETHFCNNIVRIFNHNINDLNQAYSKLYFLHQLESTLITFLEKNISYGKTDIMDELKSHDLYTHSYDEGMSQRHMKSLSMYTANGMNVYNTLDSMILDDMLLLTKILDCLHISTEHIKKSIKNITEKTKTQIKSRIDVLIYNIQELGSEKQISDAKLAYLENQLSAIQKYKPIVQALTVIHNSNSSGSTLIALCDKCIEVYNQSIYRYNEYIKQKRYQKNLELARLKTGITLWLHIIFWILSPILVLYILIKG